MLTKFRTLLLTVVLLGQASSAFAIVVIDPSNLVQNTSSAVAAVKTEISTASTYIAQLKANIELIRSTMSLDGLAKLAGLQEELAAYRDLVSTNEKLQSAINSSLALSNDLKSEYGASNFSWKKFVQSSSQTSLRRAEFLLDKYSAVNKSIQRTAERREAILTKLQDSQGQTQATQAVGAAVDVLIGQNQEMMSLLATQVANAGTEKKMKAQTQEVSDQLYNDYQESMREAAKKY